jgi:hypothetical protein
MRKLIVGLLLASVAAGPALADDDDDDRGRGHKKWQKTEREWRGGGREWNRARFDRPRFVRAERRDWDDDDDDDDDDDRWQGRRAYRQVWRDDRRDWRDQQRYLRRIAREQRRYQPIERVIRYSYAPRYAERYVRQPVRYYEAASYGYAPTSYAAAPYGFGQGLFAGGGDGVLGALLPILLSSVIGGDLGGSLGSLGGLGSVGSLAGVGGLGGIGGLGGLTNAAVYQNGYNDPYYDAYAGYPVDYGYSDYGNFSDYGSYAAINELTGVPYSVPLQQVSYAEPLTGGLIPTAYSDGDLSSLLLPALLSQGGSLF